LSFIEKGKSVKEAPAPFPYPAYSLPPSYVSANASSNTVTNINDTMSPSGQSTVGSPTASSGSTTSMLQLHNLSILSRIYIGSIHFELNDGDLKTAFSAFGPIKSVSLSLDNITGHHKGFCFIEFETPEAAALALEAMNGGELGGRTIKVGRPNNFPIDLPPGIPRPLASRLYVANVHECVTEADVRDMFAAFGNLRACVLIVSSNNSSSSSIFWWDEMKNMLFSLIRWLEVTKGMDL
jgi:RNA recognition motif-containing protein